ncbi:MAG: PSD1 and planctomycete cytochrome C domain-containing protein [Bryobacteraceae bacterium]
MEVRSCNPASRSSLFLALAVTSCFGATDDPIDFFKQRVLPVISSNCLTCHAAAKMGGLQLDSRENLLKGGNSGPAIVPGKPDESILIQAVAHTHERLKMPPQGKLSDQQVADLRTWVQGGAHWDNGTVDAVPAAKYVITPAQRRFWSFQPVQKPAAPEVHDAAWVKNPIDNFILAKLESKGLRPTAAADKRTLLRRATFDLIGLPPSPEEMENFLKDSSPDAFAKVVDRLLASPQYGERWGRHWLDVARYADADQLGLSEDPFPNAFRYRDWVIQAFNRDMPYDQFVQAQIAGDLLETDANRGELKPGLGLFGLGPWYYKIVEPAKARADERHDRVDVLTRGFLGLTVACARCHDHKYDPIATKDYYSLAGVFANTEYQESPLAPKDVVDDYKAKQAKITEQEESIKKVLDAARVRVGELLAKDTAGYLTASRKGKAAAEGLDQETLTRWTSYMKTPKEHPYLNAEPVKAADFSAMVHAVVDEKKAIDVYNVKILEDSKNSKDPYDVFCKGCNAETKTLARDKYVLWTDLFAAKQRSNEKTPGIYYYDDKQIDRFLTTSEKSQVAELREKLELLKKALPVQYPFLHTITDVAKPTDLPLHLRGDPYNLGEPVPRRFLPILSKSEPVPFREGSGRLELAKAVASPDNPLTARVLVNRMWKYHFGNGIVRTLSNFGKAGDTPSHPELLDYLASRLVENKWSIKAMHREMMLSAAYAMGSDSSAAGQEADPDNRLLWHANRSRLDAESLRDSLLFVSGKLDLQTGGPSVAWDEKNNRRTVYGKVSRFQLERMLTLFDFPDPTITCEQRAVTNVPLQRLFFLNSSLMFNAAKGFSARVLESKAADDDARVTEAYYRLFGRQPSASERRAGLQFLRDTEGKSNSLPEAWQQYAQMLLSSNEFSFVD